MYMGTSYFPPFPGSHMVASIVHVSPPSRLRAKARLLWFRAAVWMSFRVFPEEIGGAAMRLSVRPDWQCVL